MEKILPLIESSVNYFIKREKNGKIECKKDLIQHTGKLGYVIEQSFWVYNKTNQKKYLDFAIKLIQIINSNLINYQNNWVIWPGLTTNANLSTNMIDCGIIADSLSKTIKENKKLIPKKDFEKTIETIKKISYNYLNSTIPSKDISNQRLWGTTGLANACSLLKEKKFKQTALNSIERQFSETTDDGIFLYHPLPKKYNIHQGIKDTTAYYHSRHAAFIIYALELLDKNPCQYKNQLIEAGNALLSFYKENGEKIIWFETKRWYWKNKKELASNAFDIYFLAKLGEITNDKKYSYYANLSLKKLLQEHPNGFQDNFDDFQCAYFWNSHLAWVLRAEKLLEKITKKNCKEPEYELVLKQTGIFKKKTKNYSIVFRFKKQPMSICWGPTANGLLYLGTKQSSWKNLIQLDWWNTKQTLSWNYTKLGFFTDQFKEKTFEPDLKQRLSNFKHLMKTTHKIQTMKNFVSLIFKEIIKPVFVKEYSTKFSTDSEWKTISNSNQTTIYQKLNLETRTGEKSKIMIERTFSLTDKQISIKDIIAPNQVKGHIFLMIPKNNKLISKKIKLNKQSIETNTIIQF